MERVRLLWTGGWDSSFRLLHLCLVERRPVHPIYVIDPDRASTLHEIRAMEGIRAGIERRGGAGLVAPTEILVRTHYPPGPELSRMHRSIAERVHVGEQYLWLAAVAEARGWVGVELSMTRWENAPPLQQLIFTPSGNLNDSPYARLFRYWTFPLLDVAKEEMATMARQHGFLDVLAGRWFCFTPVGGKPCGYCRPCRHAYLEGVDFANPALSFVVHNVRRGRRLRRAGPRSVVDAALRRTLSRDGGDQSVKRRDA